MNASFDTVFYTNYLKDDVKSPVAVPVEDNNTDRQSEMASTSKRVRFHESEDGGKDSGTPKAASYGLRRSVTYTDKSKSAKRSKINRV